MTSTSPKPWFTKAPKINKGQKIAVIGGGIAGVFAAHHLMKQDYDVILIEENHQLLNVASGNPAAILDPLISNSGTIEKEFYLIDEPTDPKRFDSQDLMEREASYGRSGFALQFQLDTRLSDAQRYPLKVSDLIVTDIDSKAAPERLIWSSDAQYIVEELPNVIKKRAPTKPINTPKIRCFPIGFLIKMLEKIKTIIGEVTIITEALIGLVKLNPLKKASMFNVIPKKDAIKIFL